MTESSTITREMIEAAAAAIANARGGRRGAPPISNILAILPEKLLAEVREDAEAALKAALATGGARIGPTVTAADVAARAVPASIPPARSLENDGGNDGAA